MDDDSDKPMLDCLPCSEKLPMVLSGENVNPPIQVPASIAQYLRSYQRDGVRFLFQRLTAGEGGILGDDMGLGKTIQAIAFIAALLQMKGTKEDKLRHCPPYIRNDIAPGLTIPSVSPVLVICPASLTDNWFDEFQTWGHFKVFKVTTINRVDLLNKARLKECDVVIITFETARSSIDLLNVVDWTCILVDEVHRIKDTSSQISKALCSLQCKLRFGLTGTPFQNNMKEVWCLLNWSNPQSMCNLNSFTTNISRAIEQGSRSSATKREKADKALACLRFKSLKRKYMLRRTKEILAKHLPSKTDQVVFCELTATQQCIYQMITQSADLQNLLGTWKDKSTHTQKTAALKKRASLLFTFLHLLQKTANHVGLLASGLSSSTNEVTRKMCRQALEGCASLTGIPEKKWLETLSDVTLSGKMLVLSQLLPVFLEKGDKILIFSYSTKVLDFVQKHLIKMRYKFCRLDGTTPAENRCSMVRSFNSSPDLQIFLLSTKAGGVGLNITGANVVIIYDPNWNPAHDLQAQDRAYRLGQQRDVRVYRLLSTSTIEEFVYLRQIYKQQLGSCSMTSKSVRSYFNGIHNDAQYYGELFGIRNLFSFRQSSRSLTEELLEKQKQLEDKLRLKLQTPLRDKSTSMLVTPCAVVAHEENIESGNSFNTKSGLAQLCEDVLDANFDGSVVDDGEEFLDPEEASNEEEAQGSDDDSNEESVSHGESISTLLEKSSAVRHVVQHQEVVAPSKVEDFVTDCAIRDVLQKGINSQLPAFDCSVETQRDEMVPKKCNEEPSYSCSNISRLKFIQIARGEYLTPYELATKVMSMSTKEKVSLLNKYQKRQQKAVSVDTTATKRARIPSYPVIEEISPKKKTCNGTSLQNKPSKEDFAEKGRSLTEMRNAADSQEIDNLNTLGASEMPSSFEMEAISVCPSLTKDTILFMEKLICNGRQKPDSKLSDKGELPTISKTTKSCNFEARKKTEVLNQYVTEEQSPTDDTNNDSSFHKEDIDVESGCTLEAISILDSLFFSNNTRKPSPKKSNSLPVHSQSSTRVQSGTSRELLHIIQEDNSKPTKVLNSVKKLPDKPRYKLEDDVFLKLIKSGKLKRL